MDISDDWSGVVQVHRTELGVVWACTKYSTVPGGTVRVKLEKQSRISMHVDNARRWIGFVILR